MAAAAPLTRGTRGRKPQATTPVIAGPVPAGPGLPLATPGRRSSARARHRGRVENAAVMEAAGATVGGGEGTGGAGHVRGDGLRLWRPRGRGLFNDCAAAPLQCRSAARACRGGHVTPVAGLPPYPVIGRGSGAPREVPGPRPNLAAPTATADMEAVGEQAGQGLAEAGGQERGEGPTSRWQGVAAEDGSAQGTGQLRAETE